jgi:glycine/sarcosine N-methyltransferase
MPMSKETYDDFSQDYDRFVNWEARLKAELPFIEKQIAAVVQPHGAPARVLDAACGTGGHAIALARCGYAVAGADLSPKMVEQAALNANKAGAEVEWTSAGFGGLSDAFRQSALFPFDALICLGNSLPHLLSVEEIGRALADFSACLRPGGLLILQNRNFDAVMAKKERWIGPQSRRDREDEWLFLRFYDFDADGLITFNIVRLHRQSDREWQQRVSVTRLFPLLHEELLPLLDTAGFEDVRAFGLMEDIPFDARGSENLVVSARRAVGSV